MQKTRVKFSDSALKVKVQTRMCLGQIPEEQHHFVFSHLPGESSHFQCPCRAPVSFHECAENCCKGATTFKYHIFVKKILMRIGRKEILEKI